MKRAGGSQSARDLKPRPNFALYQGAVSRCSRSASDGAVEGNDKDVVP